MIFLHNLFLYQCANITSKCSEGSCDMKKAFISIVISRLPVQLGGCQRILRCARDRLEPLSLLPLQLTLSVKKRCTVIMHSFDLYCTALHSCVCIVQIILCILVHCALRLTMANYSHCREHRCSFPGGKTMGGKPQCSFPANRRHTTAWPRGRFTENMPKSKPKCLHG